MKRAWVPKINMPFNDATLAKHAWRLFGSPNGLCARVAKGRYYLEGDFLLVGCLLSASPTYQAIKGKEVLKQGLVRRIRDGRTSHICHDN